MTKIILLSVFFISLMVASYGLEHDWTYKLLNIEYYSSDRDLVDADLKIERKNDDETALSGYIDIKIPLDDATYISAFLERSATATEGYEKTPFKLINSTLTDTMNGLYAAFIMNAVKDCAPDAPQFENFEAPLEPKRIELNKCNLNVDVFPARIKDGFYRIIGTVTGPVEIKVQLYFEIIKTTE